MNMNERAKNAAQRKKDSIKQYFADISKLNPAYQRYQDSLSAYILEKIMTYCTANIFARKQEYIDKFNISRRFFIRVFNLYCSLSFMTVLRKIKKSQKGA